MKIAAGAFALFCASLVFVCSDAFARNASPEAAPTASAAPSPTESAAPSPTDVVSATLANGLRVAILPNSLAPVVTSIIVYDVGSDDDTSPGIAHATEHMLFRGTPTLSAARLADIAARMGAQYNALTGNEHTSYYYRLPSAYLDVALRIEADRMINASIAAKDWNDERPAIEDEVRGYESQPSFAIGQKLRASFFKGTPFASAGAGTIPSFEKMTADDIRAFYHRWYAPANATLIVAGAVDPARALAEIRRAFDHVPNTPVPQRSPFAIPPLDSATLTEPMDFPVGFSALMYRMPGANDPDFAAARVLGEVLKSGRSGLTDLTAHGKALVALAMGSAFPEVGAEFVIGIPPVGGTPDSVRDAMRAVLEEYRRDGVPPELVADAKLKLLSERAYREASISGLAFAWADAVGRRVGPDEEDAALAAVTPDDVDRVLRASIDPAREVALTVVPHPSGGAAKIDPNAGVENVAYTPTVHEPLPAWAQSALSVPLAPPDESRIVGRTLKNGIRLAVRRESTSPTIVLTGIIRGDDQLYEPKGKDGVGKIVDALLPWGTTDYDRKTYQAQFDAIAATSTLGRSFSLRMRASDLERGMDLLADGLLHPAFDPGAFATVRAQFVQALSISSKLPKSRAEEAERDVLYAPGDPRRRAATPATIGALGLSDVKSYYRFAYRPDLTAIAIVGDVTPERARAAVEHSFGAWAASGRAPTFAYPDVAEPGSRERTVVVKSATARESDVTLKQFVRVSRYDADYIPLLLANTMLSGEGTGSILFGELRTRRGYVYSVDSAFDAQGDGQSFTVTYATEPKNVARADAAVSAIIRRLRSAPLPLVDLQRAKAQLIAGRVLPLDSYSGVAEEMLAGAKVGYYGDRAAFWKALVEVTPAQLERAMRRISPDRFVRTIVEPE